MAPEQELGHLSRQSDLYSLAVTLYETLTGRLPFDGPDCVRRRRDGDPVPPASVVAGLKSWLVQRSSRSGRIRARHQAGFFLTRPLFKQKFMGKPALIAISLGHLNVSRKTIYFPALSSRKVDA